MSDENRLSRTNTLWSVVLRAHGEDSVERQPAQRDLLDRYGFAIRRYLNAGLRDETAVDEVFQEFALAFVRGDYARLSPDRGRFRSFLKTVLFRLVADFRRAQYRRDNPAVLDDQVDRAEDATDNGDEEFTMVWRESLLGRTWARLESFQTDTGKPLFTVLRVRSAHPEMSSTELAAELTEKLNKPISASNTRVMIHRAREQFANLLLNEIIPSLDEPTFERLEEELIDLGLIEYCRNTLEDWRQAGEL